MVQVGHLDESYQQKQAKNKMSNDGGSDSTGHVNKMGRRGDPRMHRAVAARLKDPELSLYEALRIGGFDYTVDDDSHSIDQDKVTLGQRKNQLSRRLRLAKKQQQQQPLSNSGANHWRPGQQPFEDGRKRSASAVLEDTIDANMMHDDREEESERPALKAKNHPDFHPISVVPLTTGIQNKSFNSQLSQHSMQQPSNTLRAPAMSAAPQPHLSLANNLAAFSSLATSPYDLPPHLAGVMNHPGQHQHLPQPSGVAIATLNATAQSVGMTLEQLALSLSRSSHTLVQFLTASSGKEQLRKQEELALNLYHNENRALYRRAMLLAGYSGAQATEGTSEHLRFALKAWQQEGNRLSQLQATLMPDDAPMQMSPSTTSAAAATVAGLKNASDGHSHAHAHDHGHSHDDKLDDHCAFDEGRHIHRLDCGHKAILHQPTGGTAHIDFVIGNKVECYQGYQNAPPTNKGEHAWPSQYRCEDLSCENPHVEKGKPHEHSEYCRSGGNPKLLDLDEIDLDGKEWNTSVGQEMWESS